MSDQVLALNHQRFSFRLSEGVVRETNSWSESHTEGGGGSVKVVAGFGTGHTNKVRTTVENHIEFWVETTEGKERYYKVDANCVKVRGGQEVRVIDCVTTSGKKAGQYELVMLYNMKQEMLYTCMRPFDLVQTERPWAVELLIGYMIFGVLGIKSVIFGPIYILTLLFGIPYLIKKRRYYKKKLKALQQYLFSLPSELRAA